MSPCGVMVDPMSTAKTRRLAVAAAMVAMAIAGPAVASLSAPAISAEGQCLAWFGSRGDGQCMGYSNGTPTYIGTPNLGVYGPGGGFYTGPLMPGTTFTEGLTP